MTGLMSISTRTPPSERRKPSGLPSACQLLLLGKKRGLFPVVPIAQMSPRRRVFQVGGGGPKDVRSVPSGREQPPVTKPAQQPPDDARLVTVIHRQPLSSGLPTDRAPAAL